jgi:hypothetical protein
MICVVTHNDKPPLILVDVPRVPQVGEGFLLERGDASAALVVMKVRVTEDVTLVSVGESVGRFVQRKLWAAVFDDPKDR